MPRFFRVEHSVFPEPGNPLSKVVETLHFDLDEIDLLQSQVNMAMSREAYGIGFKSGRQMVVSKDVYELVLEQLYKGEAKRLSVVHD